MKRNIEDLTNDVNGIINELQQIVNNIRNIDFIPYCERDVNYMALMVKRLERAQKLMQKRIDEKIEIEEDYV